MLDCATCSYGSLSSADTPYPSDLGNSSYDPTTYLKSSGNHCSVHLTRKRPPHGRLCSCRVIGKSDYSTQVSTCKTPCVWRGETRLEHKGRIAAHSTVIMIGTDLTTSAMA